MKGEKLELHFLNKNWLKTFRYFSDSIWFRNSFHLLDAKIRKASKY